MSRRCGDATRATACRRVELTSLWRMALSATVRTATSADAASVASIHMASRAATMPYLPTQRRTLEQVTTWARDVLMAHCRVWVACRADAPLAYAALNGDYLEHLYVRPDHLRHGLGAQLLNVVKQNSPSRVWLHVFQKRMWEPSSSTPHTASPSSSRPTAPGTWSRSQTTLCNGYLTRSDTTISAQARRRGLCRRGVISPVAGVGAGRTRLPLPDRLSLSTPAVTQRTTPRHSVRPARRCGRASFPRTRNPLGGLRQESPRCPRRL